jgi:hypothetical protein
LYMFSAFGQWTGGFELPEVWNIIRLIDFWTVGTLRYCIIYQIMTFRCSFINIWYNEKVL